MLVIHLSNGDILTTEESYTSLKDDLKDNNYDFITVRRHKNFKDVARSDRYKGDTVLTIIDKCEIAYIDILED
jgi:hypothetical protein